MNGVDARVPGQPVGGAGRAHKLQYAEYHKPAHSQPCGKDFIFCSDAPL